MPSIVVANGPIDLHVVVHGAGTAVLYPDKVAAVAGLSVPYYPLRAVSFIERMREAYRGKCFYQLCYQTEGAAEAEMESDLARGLLAARAPRAAACLLHCRRQGCGALLCSWSRPVRGAGKVLQ
jgi:hypothetical protein